MILEKIICKFTKKSDNYFLELETNTPEADTISTKEPSSEVATETPETETEEVATTSTETEAQETTAPPAPSTPKYVVSFDPPAWVSAIKNYSNDSAEGEGGENTPASTNNNYAGKYVSNNIASARRRPGGSLNKFRDIASTMKK